jgi:hypothetical protein
MLHYFWDKPIFFNSSMSASTVPNLPLKSALGTDRSLCRCKNVMHNTLKEQITDWSESVIALLKQKMWAEEVSLVCSSGRPWYRREDSWVSESWWIEAAEHIYKKHCENPDRWLTAELEVLCQHFPSQYRAIARQRLDHWYNEHRAHDPENWLELTCQVYPEHPILKEFLDDDVEWQLASASLGDPVQIERIRDRFGEHYQEQDNEFNL